MRLLFSLSLLSLSLLVAQGRPLDDELAPVSYVLANLGTKSPYSPMATAADHTPPPEYCDLVHMEYLARHGSREPTSGGIQSQADLQAKIQAFLAAGGQFNPQYSWMANWTSPFISGEAGLLADVGMFEHYNTSKRMIAEYKDILGLQYNPNRYDFQETQVSRTGVSASSFAFGMMENRGTLGASKYAPAYVWSETKSKDLKLRFFDNCPYYSSSVLNNKTSNEQYYEFMTVLDRNALLLSKRLGTFPIWVLTTDDYNNMWDACVYQNDLYDIQTQWCNIWTYEDVDDLAFSEDLDFYWQKGYGYSIDWTIAVNLFDDIATRTMTALMKMKNFQTQCQNWTKGMNADCDTMVQNAKYQNTCTFRFAHAETVVPALAWLGLYYTLPSLMMATTPKAQRDTRLWKTTILSPYAANINFLTYACKASEKEDYTYALLKVLHNEQEISLPYCDGVYCEFSQFMSYYKDQLDMNFNTLCNP